MMAEESQISPLAPVEIYGRSDEESATTKPTAVPYHRHPEKTSKCVVYVLAGIVVQSAVMLVFASIVLRVTSPDLKLRSVAVQSLRYNGNTSNLNMTMRAEITVENENFGRFKFDDCKAVVLYGNNTLGEGNINSGRAGARKTEVMNITMQVSSDFNGSGLNFTGGDVLELVSYAKMRGKVHVMKVVKKIKTVEMNCTMNLNLTSRAIKDLLCQ